VALEAGGFMVGDGRIDTLAVPTSFVKGSGLNRLRKNNPPRKSDHRVKEWA
jgi:hypothetical protein